MKVGSRNGKRTSLNKFHLIYASIEKWALNDDDCDGGGAGDVDDGCGGSVNENDDVSTL